VGLIIGALAILLYPRFKERLPSLPTFGAMPSIPASDTVAANLTDMSAPRSLVSGMRSAVASITPILESQGPERSVALRAVASSLDGLGDIMNATEEMSFLSSSSGDGALYLAMIVKGDALDLFMSRPGALYSVDEWGGSPSGSDGWVMHTAFAKERQIYVAKLPIFGQSRSMVYVSDSEAGISAMMETAEGKSPAFSHERHTAGDNFIQVKFQNGLTRGMVADMMEEKSTARELWAREPDKVLYSVTETSWSKDGSSLGSVTYSDFFERNPEVLADRPKTAGEPLLLGDGNLAGFMALDSGLLTGGLFPGLSDTSAISDLTDNQSAMMITNELAPILKHGRLSMLCTETDRKARTAYIALETDAADRLEKMYGEYSPLTAMFGGTPIQMEGWDSAISITIPLRGETKSKNIIIAHRRGTLLAGVGELEDFGKKFEMDGEYKDYVSKDNLMNLIITANLYDIFIGMLENMPDGTAGTNPQQVRATTAGLNKLRESFESVCGNLKTDGRAGGRIVATDGGDPIAAMFEFFAQTAAMMPRANATVR
jgi:hypothetical protein